MKDKEIFDRFLESTNSNYKICEYLYKDKFPTVALSIKSDNICSDLKTNFNIIPRKSLILTPPNIHNKNEIDSFIIGYIDGDGSVGLYKSKRQKSLTISMLGTKEMLEWIQNRFSEILKEKLNCIYSNKNIYVLTISDKRARNIFLHYYSINVNKLTRKWSLEKYNHCLNYKKYENLDKYEQILSMERSGLKQKEIGKNMKISQAAVSWYQKRDTYKKLKEESKQLDENIIDIEAEEQ